MWSQIASRLSMKREPSRISTAPATSSIPAAPIFRTSPKATFASSAVRQTTTPQSPPPHIGARPAFRRERTQKTPVEGALQMTSKMPKKSSQWSVPAVLCAASLLLSGAAYAQSGANAALCKEFNIKVNQCMSRAITIDSAEESGEGGGHSSQAEAFRNCYNVYCRGAIIAGCSISDTCKYGL